jgi:hypothetical protein
MTSSILLLAMVDGRLLAGPAVALADGRLPSGGVA